MTDRDRSFCYPLAIQFALPQRYREDRELGDTLDGLRGAGFTGVELNIADPFSLDWTDLFAFLKEHGLGMFRFASGLTAKTLSLSLSAADDETRQRSVIACRRMIRALGGTGIGIIIGFFKGPVASDRDGARSRFAQSLAELVPEAAGHGVPLVVEATNRYESSVANSLDDTAALLPASEARGRWAQILPDTFHMNIEERDTSGALVRHAALFSSIHLSDNNRLFPGRGAISFGPIIGTLRRIGWKGFLAIEGMTTGGLLADARDAVEALAPHLA
ncbi:MAG: sugar phosphate isomerase/epimerase [Spirochaetes bacterium]|nr:sugar phosphate isomerase/epimerase [Spirochaetota bacterium]